MAAYEAGVGSPEARKAWSKIVAYEALKQTKMGQFIGGDNKSLVQKHTDLEQGAGDRIRVPLQKQLVSRGVVGDEVMEGQEEAMEIFTDDLFVNQLRNAAKSKGKMSEQRVPFKVRERIGMGLSDWMAGRLDLSLATQLCGYTAITPATLKYNFQGDDVAYTGLNATIAPSTSTHFFSTAAASTDEDLATTSAETMKLSLLDDMKAEAKERETPIQPIRYKGEDLYVAFLHPYQVRDLRQDASTAGNWVDIQKAAMQGGDVADNPIFTGALGMYNNIVLHEWSRITPGVDSTTSARVDGVRRALFCGAQAAMIAFAGGCTDESWDWVEQFADYKNALSASVGCIFGIKKSIYDGEDFATMVLSTRAVSKTPGT